MKKELTSRSYIDEIKKALPPNFVAKGDFYVFVDECHRTQSGDLHNAMKSSFTGGYLPWIYRNSTT